MDKRYRYYGRGLGQFRMKYGRRKTYLLLLVCTIVLCGLLYLAYRLDMK